MRSFHDIRPSPLAGRWYPAGQATLHGMIDEMLATAGAPARNDIHLVGLLAPHAGIRYSGPVAAGSYNYLRGKQFETVVIIGPMHYPIRGGAILTTGHEAYQTPLGEMPVDRELLETVNSSVSLHQIRNDPEHSVEIELPFLQCTLAQPERTRILPLMLVSQSVSTAHALADALADALRDRSALCIASSDLSHFYTQQIAHRLDQEVLDRFNAYDADGIIDADDQGIGLSCGHGAIAAVLLAARGLGAQTAEITAYATSGDVTGDLDQVVGYGAGVIYRE